jgi:hypothetical protein
VNKVADREQMKISAASIDKVDDDMKKGGRKEIKLKELMVKMFGAANSSLWLEHYQPAFKKE